MRLPPTFGAIPWLSAVLILAAVGAAAESFPYLYHGVVIGEGRQPAPAEISRALSQVLTRLTGITDPQDNAQLRELLSRSTQLVSEYELLPAGAAGKARFRIGFHRRELTQHLKAQGLSIWDNDHPLLLLLVVQTDGAHPVSILTTGDDRPQARPLRIVAENLQYQRGLLMMLPIRDLDEQQLVQRQVLEGDYRRAARILKKRYGVRAVILIHLEKIGIDDWYAESRFFGDIEGKLPTGASPDVVRIMRDTINRIGDYYWALNARRPRLAHGLQLVVEDVRDYSGMRRILQILREILPAEQQPTLARMTAQQMEFNFRSEYPVARIKQLIAGRTDLLLIERRPVPGAITQIHARLVPPPLLEDISEDTLENIPEDSPDGLLEGLSEL